MSTTPQRAATATLLGEAFARIAALESQQASTLARLAVLEQRGRGPRDDADLRVLELLFAIVGGGEFTARAVIERAHLDADVRDALNAADLVTVTDVGIWLRRCCDIEVGGCRLVPVGRDRVGRRWQLVPGGDGSPIVTPP